MSQNAREFLREQGFTVGERGRFSADMLKALADAGIDPKAKGDAAPKAPRVSRSPKPKPVAKTAPQVRVRSKAKFTAVSGGIRLVYDMCFNKSCNQHATFCNCPNGPAPPVGFKRVVDSRSALV